MRAKAAGADEEEQRILSALLDTARDDVSREES
jgi:hypothetical protein